MPIPYHFCAALGTILYRHVETAGVFAPGKKLGMTAMRAAVMRHQRINFRNIGHAGHKA